MRNPEKAVFTNMCMIVNGSKVLVQRRVKGCWTGFVFPGGHLDALETATESTIREIKEETGLTVSNLKLCGIKQWFNDVEGRNVCFMFKTETFNGNIISSDEGKISWMELEDLKNSAEMAPNFEMMLKLYLSEDLNEMYCPEDGSKEFLL